jgi:hypothetical protein
MRGDDGERRFEDVEVEVLEEIGGAKNFLNPAVRSAVRCVWRSKHGEILPDVTQRRGRAQAGTRGSSLRADSPIAGRRGGDRGEYHRSAVNGQMKQSSLASD